LIFIGAASKKGCAGIKKTGKIICSLEWRCRVGLILIQVIVGIGMALMGRRNPVK
jgi:hypothetical protein